MKFKVRMPILALLILASAAIAQERRLPKVVTAGADQTLRLWDAAGKEAQNLLAHDATVTAVVVASDGKTAFSASADRTIKSWNLEDGSKSKTFMGHDQEVTCLALNPDGRMLA